MANKPTVPSWALPVIIRFREQGRCPPQASDAEIYHALTTALIVVRDMAMQYFNAPYTPVDEEKMRMMFDNLPTDFLDGMWFNIIEEVDGKSITHVAPIRANQDKKED